MTRDTFPGPRSRASGPRFVSRSRDAGVSEAEARRAWTLVLAQAADLAERAGRGAAVGKLEGAPFAGLVVRLREPFPLRWVSAQAAAEAFLVLARASVAAGWPPQLAGFVGAGAACLTAMLDAETRAAFARSCAATGEGAGEG